MHELGEIIKKARGSMTGLQLAERSKVPSWKISRIETGSYKDIPDPDVIKGLSEALHIPQYQMLRALGYDVGPANSKALADAESGKSALVRDLAQLPLDDVDLEAMRHYADYLVKQKATRDRRRADQAAPPSS